MLVFKSENKACKKKKFNFFKNANLSKLDGIPEIGINILDRLHNDKINQFLDLC